MPITARDPELKAQRGYSDPKSFVRVDGSEVLKGRDWARRVAELQERSKGRCEQICPGGRCLADARDPHHVIKRWPRRDDSLSNLLHVCGTHHYALDPRKPRWSSKA
jgi:hypothetical protein